MSNYLSNLFETGIENSDSEFTDVDSMLAQSSAGFIPCERFSQQKDPNYSREGNDVQQDEWERTHVDDLYGNEKLVPPY